MHTPAPAGQTLNVIQYLRAVAALAVVASHAPDQVAVYMQYFDFALGKAGVDLFFVISGFIMVTAARARSGADFFVRRLIRVVPLYWGLTLLLAGAGLMLPQLLRVIHVTPEGVAQSLLFIPHVTQGVAGPLLAPGWTLNFEMLFYAVFAVLFAVPVLRRIALMTSLFAAMVAVGLLWPVVRDNPIGEMLTSPLLLEFTAGMMVGYGVQRGWLPGPRLAVAMVLAAGVWMALAHGAGLHRVVFAGLPAVAVVWALVALERAGHMPKAAVLRHLGDASYSIYLSHLFVYGVVRIVWPRVFDSGSYLEGVGYMLCMMGAAIIAGLVLYHLAERPVTRLLNRQYASN